jgi:S-DNA-T family DNA segregation ATPase FtsK/SpoIIIE
VTRGDPYRAYRRQMRRSVRGRHGRVPYLPVPVPVDYGYGYRPLWAAGVAALARLAYRHRSAFWPLLIAAAAFTAGHVLHDHHPAAWAVTVPVTFCAGVLAGLPHRLAWPGPGGRLTAGLVTRAWEACGITRPAERAYAAAVITVTGGWLSAAIAAGPGARPLPAIAAVATVVLGVPWWAHRRRRARVRV